MQDKNALTVAAALGGLNVVFNGADVPLICYVGKNMKYQVMTTTGPLLHTVCLVDDGEGQVVDVLDDISDPDSSISIDYGGTEKFQRDQ